MSRARRALMRKALAARKQDVVTWITMRPSMAKDLVDANGVLPGEVKRAPFGEWGQRCWLGRSEDGGVYVMFLDPLVKTPKGVRPPRITDDQIVEHVREALAQLVEEAASRPKNPRSAPRPLGNEARTLAARAAVLARLSAQRSETKPPATIGKRLVRCPGCGTKNEVPAIGDALARCSACGTGGL